MSDYERAICYSYEIYPMEALTDEELSKIESMYTDPNATFDDRYSYFCALLSTVNKLKAKLKKAKVIG